MAEGDSYIIDGVPCEFCDCLIPISQYSSHVGLHDTQREEYTDESVMPLLGVSNNVLFDLSDTLVPQLRGTMANLVTLYNSDPFEMDTDSIFSSSEDSNDEEPPPRPSVRRRILQSNLNTIELSTLGTTRRRTDNRRRRSEPLGLIGQYMTHTNSVPTGNLRRYLAQGDPEYRMTQPLLSAPSENYEYYLRLGESIGNVDCGIDDLESVSKIISIHDLSKEDTKCPICLDIYEILSRNSIQFRELACGHQFCDPCISEWLSKKKLCPLCKVDLEES